MICRCALPTKKGSHLDFQIKDDGTLRDFIA